MENTRPRADQGPVRWVQDEDFMDRSATTVGCCPYAQRIYHEYAAVDYRCCTGRDRWRMLPQKPIGGCSWKGCAGPQLESSHLLFVGDSMVEQQFLALLCHAWATNVSVDAFSALPSEWTRAFWGSRERLMTHVERGWHAVITPWKVAVTYVFADHISRLGRRAGQLFSKAGAATADQIPRNLLGSSNLTLILGGWTLGVTVKGDAEQLIRAALTSMATSDLAPHSRGRADAQSLPGRQLQ